jgi:hypothetical protein
MTTPRSRSTEFTRHAAPAGARPPLEDQASDSDLVPAVIKFTRSLFMEFSTRRRRHAQATLHAGDGLGEMICGEAGETRVEQSKRRDEPHRVFNAKSQRVEGSKEAKDLKPFKPLTLGAEITRSVCNRVYGSGGASCLLALVSVSDKATNRAIKQIAPHRTRDCKSPEVGARLDSAHFATTQDKPEGRKELMRHLPDSYSPHDSDEPESRRTPEHFTGCLLGGAVGDALGAPVEFHSIRLIRDK